MVEWGGLENRCTLTGTVGSNPTPSADADKKNFWMRQGWRGIVKAQLLRVAWQHIEPRCRL